MLLTTVLVKKECLLHRPLAISTHRELQSKR